MRDIINKIENILTRLKRLESMEFSRVVAPAQPVRILDDTTARATGYINAGIQVTGVAGLPSKITAIWIKVTLIATAAASSMTASMDNPDSILGANSVAGYAAAAGSSVTGLVVVHLSSTGAFRFNLTGPGTNRIIYDVVAYQL